MGKKGKKKATAPVAASASCSQLTVATQPLAALDANSVIERDAEQAELEAACARAGLGEEEREKEHAILRACRAAGVAYIKPGDTPYMAELQLHKAKRRAAAETRARRHKAMREAIRRESKAVAVQPAASSTAVAQRGADPPPAACSL